MSQHWLQVVKDHYSGWGDPQLVDYWFTFFAQTARQNAYGNNLLTELVTHRGLPNRQKGLQKKLPQRPTLCASFWTLGCRSEGMWHNAHMPTRGSTWFNGAVEPLSQMNNCDCAS